MGLKQTTQESMMTTFQSLTKFFLCYTCCTKLDGYLGQHILLPQEPSCPKIQSLVIPKIRGK